MRPLEKRRFMAAGRAARRPPGVGGGRFGASRLTWTLTVESGGATASSEEQGLDIFRRQPDGSRAIAGYLDFADH
jgi:hypothetical protein